jgi:hypothetical protein
MVKHVFDIQFVGDESWIWLVEPPFLGIEIMSDFIRRTCSILRPRIHTNTSLSQDPTRVSSPRAAKFTACSFDIGANEMNEISDATVQYTGLFYHAFSGSVGRLVAGKGL